MKILKNSNYIFYVLIPVLLSSCDLAGLELQKDHNHETTVLDPDLHMTAWEFLNVPQQDSLRNFDRMLQAIEYTGFEEEYTKPNRTFILFTSYAVLRHNTNGLVNSGTYFGRNRVPLLDENGEPVLDENDQPMTRPGEDWTDYPVEQIRELLLYHIIDGEYSYHNLGPDNTEVQTFSPVDTANVMYMKIENNRNSKIRINDFPGSARAANARTANLKATNGYVHVFDSFQFYEVND